MEQESVLEVEKAIADIQLLGTSYQVELARTFASDFVENRSASLDSLLSELRKDLRRELDLEETSSNTIFFRYVEPRPSNMDR